MLKALAPFGLTRWLLAIERMSLYPEQSIYRANVSPLQYRRWVAAVCRSFAGSAADEQRTVIATAEYARRSADDVPAPELDDLPLGILTSQAFGQGWIAWHDDMTKPSSNSFHRVTDTKRHNIHLQHPDLVADAIRQLIAAAEAVPTSGRPC